LLQQTAAAILVNHDIMAQRAAAAAERGVRALRALMLWERGSVNGNPNMVSQRNIARYARSWMDYYPETTENELRDQLHQRFLQRPATWVDAAGFPLGCLFILLAVLKEEWQRTFPKSRRQVAADSEAVEVGRRKVATDIEAVLAECRAQCGWPAAEAPDIDAVLAECQARFGWPAASPPGKPNGPQDQSNAEPARGHDPVRLVVYGFVAVAVGLVMGLLILAGVLAGL
jgi:hypothetical protein